MTAPENPTVIDLFEYCAAHAGCIFVRTELNGKWDSYSLTELPLPVVLAWIFEWVRRGQWPVAAHRGCDLEKPETE